MRARAIPAWLRAGTQSVAIGVGALLSVLAWRTWQLGAAPAHGGTALALAAAPPIDAQRAAEHLAAALRFQTVSHEDPSLDDTTAWDALQEFLLRTYPSWHAHARRERVAGRTLLYTWPGSQPELAPIIVMAHQDVVPAADDAAQAWLAPPFAGTLRDGAVWGRGAIDDKGSLIALCEALEALSALGFTPRRTLYLVSGHDEETQGSGAHAAAMLLQQRGVRAWFVLDEGLFVLRDHPLTHQPAALIGIAEKGFATLNVTARAQGGHSAAPPDNGAVVTLAKALLAIMNHPAPLHYSALTERMLRALAPQLPWSARLAVANSGLFAPLLRRQFAATPAGAAMLHTTMAPTMLQGAPKSNVLPAAAVAKINYRLAPGDSAAAALARARAAVGDLPVELAWQTPVRESSALSSSDTSAFRTMAVLAREQWGVPTAPALMLGGTDGGQMSAVAQDIYRFQPIDLSLAESSMIHGRDEHLQVVQLQRMIEFYARLIRTLAG